MNKTVSSVDCARMAQSTVVICVLAVAAVCQTDSTSTMAETRDVSVGPASPLLSGRGTVVAVDLVASTLTMASQGGEAAFFVDTSTGIFGVPDLGSLTPGVHIVVSYRALGEIQVAEAITVQTGSPGTPKKTAVHARTAVPTVEELEE